METTVNLDRIKHFVCLEPEVGEHLLPLYPDFLSEQEKKQFELHREGCEYCQERWKLWQVTGLSLRIRAILKHAAALLKEHRHEDALREYNRAIALDPYVLDTPEGETFFQEEVGLPLTAAKIKEKNIMPYVAPSYAPETYELAAAESFDLFPVSVEYAEGKVRGKFTVAGRLVFFELLEAEEEFKQGVTLIGKVVQESSVSLKLWHITPGKKHRLETLANLFGAARFPDVIQALRTFKVVSL